MTEISDTAVDHADMMAYAMLAEAAERSEVGFIIRRDGHGSFTARIDGWPGASGHTLAIAVVKLTERYPEIFQETQ